MMLDFSTGSSTGAERQRAYAERRRRMSPLQRDLRLPAEVIYTSEELVLLSRIKKARDRLLEDCARLNLLLRARLLAESVSPGLSPAERTHNQRVQHLLQRNTYIVLPEF